MILGQFYEFECNLISNAKKNEEQRNQKSLAAQKNREQGVSKGLPLQKEKRTRQKMHRAERHVPIGCLFMYL